MAEIETAPEPTRSTPGDTAPDTGRPGALGATRRLEGEVLRDGASLAGREWIVANGLGGFASATVSGALTRRYHGLLVAALNAPRGRVVLLSHLGERLRTVMGAEVPLAPVDGTDSGGDGPAPALESFTLEDGLPVWRYRLGDAALTRRLVMPHRQNIVHVSYQLDDGAPETVLLIRPMLNIRPLEGPVSQPADRGYRVSVAGQRFEVSADGEAAKLRLKLVGAEGRFTLGGEQRREVFYAVEAERGYDSRGTLWSPGEFAVRLEPGRTVTLVAGAEDWDTIDSLDPADVRDWERKRRHHLLNIAPACCRSGIPAELVLAADSFLMTPVGRTADVIQAYATGDAVRSVIAGYHWFTDWGRDTMIALEGLTLCTGRHAEAGWILRTFARHIRRGLIPNMFPEGRNTGLYHTADATLWFFHALNRYTAATGERDTLRRLLPRLLDIVNHHRHGTDFGIVMDPADGLLRQGAPGYQLTWMDAKVEDWVVTPRRGKAVEINALWYNALRLLAGWLEQEQGVGSANLVHDLADRARDSFNRRFWSPDAGYLFDVVDGEHGDDAACRPNQLFAISLDSPVLDRERWEPVMRTVTERLLTPVGLRSLDPGHRDYQRRYFGDLRARDAAYHQGTVWGWLIGPYIDAWLKLHPDDKDGARAMLDGLWPHLSEAGVGTIAEVFDADPPFTPRGCVSQAWSVAEALRCWVKTA